MNAPENDSIAVTGLGLVCRIGVPEEERAVPQRLEADLVLWPCRDFRDLGDSLEGTVDYGAVALQCREVAASRDRQLIETLAADLAAALLAAWPLRAVRVTVRKFILPDCGSVSVTVLREASV